MTATFVAPEGAVWFAGQSWRPGLVIGHQDAAPYNAVWQAGSIGFVDWDAAGPSSRELDLAYAALWWVPMHARHVVAPLGFTRFEDRGRRLRVLLDAYGYDGDRAAFPSAVAGRARLNAAVVRRRASGDDPVYRGMLTMADDLDHAADEIEDLLTTFWTDADPTRDRAP